MIFDKISNSKSYVNTHPLFEKAFAFLDIYLKNPVENEEDDVQFLKDVDGGLEFLLKAGEFAIFFPQDAHKPAMNVAGKAKAKKQVFKVRVEV